MDVGIGLPNAVRGVDRAGVVDWAVRAERAGFSTLGTIDRIVYDNYESLIVLAAAAAVTERIGLATDILIAPLRANTALLAKQAATLNDLSQGRLVLGLAVGGREDDYAVSGVDFHRPGRACERQLEELHRHWRGETGVGPASRPTLLVGGGSDAAIRRAARPGGGGAMGGAGPRTRPPGAPPATGTGGPWAAPAPTRSPRRSARCRRRGGPQAARTARAPWPSATSRSATRRRSPRAPRSATTTGSSGRTPSGSSPPRPPTRGGCATCWPPSTRRGPTR